MTFNEYTKKAVAARRPGLRWGQVMFNTLYEVRPDLAEQVRGTDIDPFYDDARGLAFMAFVVGNW